MKFIELCLGCNLNTPYSTAGGRPLNMSLHTPFTGIINSPSLFIQLQGFTRMPALVHCGIQFLLREQFRSFNLLLSFGFRLSHQYISFLAWVFLCERVFSNDSSGNQEILLLPTQTDLEMDDFIIEVYCILGKGCHVLNTLATST